MNFKVIDKQNGHVLNTDEIIAEVNRDRSDEWTDYDVNDLSASPREVLDWLDTEYYEVKWTAFSPDEIVNIPNGTGGVLPALMLGELGSDSSKVRCLDENQFPFRLIKVKNFDVSKHDGVLSEKSKALLEKARASISGLN